jgi:uncharacterized protein
MEKLNIKLERVKERLKSLGKGKAAVAFSGGKDSFFLLKIAVETLGKENVSAFFVKTAFSTQNDEKRVHYFTHQLDFNLKRMNIDITKNREVKTNAKDRCYFCKRKIFEALKAQASRLGIDTVLDGTTYSDLDEYRPGLKAIEELNIVSPLQEAKITSGEVVSFLKETLNIDDYYLTSSTCLATRFPYNFTLDEKILRTFDEIEAYFVQQGIYPVKIRFIEDGIRIETSVNNFTRIFQIKEKFLKFCKKKGVKFVTLDIEGIKTGSSKE